jgi:hypothetical protein
MLAVAYVVVGPVMPDVAGWLPDRGLPWPSSLGVIRKLVASLVKTLLLVTPSSLHN